MMYQILFSGMDKPKEFDGLLEAFEYVRKHGRLTNFMLKCGERPWEDGSEVYNGMKRLFA